MVVSELNRFICIVLRLFRWFWWCSVIMNWFVVCIGFMVWELDGLMLMVNRLKMLMVMFGVVLGRVDSVWLVVGFGCVVDLVGCCWWLLVLL